MFHHRTLVRNVGIRAKGLLTTCAQPGDSPKKQFPISPQPGKVPVVLELEPTLEMKPVCRSKDGN